MKRAPDFQVGRYLKRWWVIPRNRFFNVYLHEFSASDPADLHDHPWVNCSIILKGSYIEHFHDRTSRLRNRGHVVFRGATTLHRLELVTRTVTTLFITGPVVRRWGFLTRAGWVHHESYPARRPGEGGA